MRPITSNSLRMMEKSMDFLWAKQAAHLDNISNAETPGYKVKTVTFEETFDAHLRRADGRSGNIDARLRHTLEHGTEFDERLRYAITRMRGAPQAKMREVIEEADWTVWEDQESTRMDENGVNVIEQSVEAVRTAYQLQYVMKSISSDLTTLGKAING